MNNSGAKPNPRGHTVSTNRAQHSETGPVSSPTPPATSMRIPLLATTLATSVTLAACAASPSASPETQPVASCDRGVVATVSNQTGNQYDVMYQTVRSEIVLGEAGPNSTVTFSLPGDGQGRVYLRTGITGQGGRVSTDGRRGVRVTTRCAS